MNTLYFGDNLEVMREMDDQRVDLICTDPPFNSGRDYNAFLTDSLAQSKAFTDTWTWDDPAQDARADIERRARASDTYKAFWGNYKMPISEEYLASHYRQVDDQGRRCRIRVDAGKRDIIIQRKE